MGRPPKASDVNATVAECSGGIRPGTLRLQVWMVWPAVGAAAALQGCLSKTQHLLLVLLYFAHPSVPFPPAYTGHVISSRGATGILSVVSEHITDTMAPPW